MITMETFQHKINILSLITFSVYVSLNMSPYVSEDLKWNKIAFEGNIFSFFRNAFFGKSLVWPCIFIDLSSIRNLCRQSVASILFVFNFIRLSQATHINIHYTKALRNLSHLIQLNRKKFFQYILFL